MADKELKNIEFEVIRFGNVPQNGMVAALLTRFNLLELNACIGGGMKTGTLMFGKPEDVEEEVKRTLDIMMPGGGYFSANTVALDKVPAENMHAWREAIEKYGKY